MTVEMILQALESHKNVSVINRYVKAGETQPYIGVLMGKINHIAKSYSKESQLALPLWQTGLLEAQLVAIQLMSPKGLSLQDIDDMLDERLSLQVLDKLADRVLSHHPDRDHLQQLLLDSDSIIRQRLGWRLLIKAVGRQGVAHDCLEQHIAYIHAHLSDSPEVLKWVMNQCLVEIALSYPQYRDKILSVTAELGVYQDMIVPKGCTSAYAPAWIAARLKKEG